MNLIVPVNQLALGLANRPNSMSNEVYGYFEGSEVLDRNMLLKSLEEKTGLGVKPIPLGELYNYPTDMLPSDVEDCTAFIIGDKPGKSNATYLIDYIDYAPGADIGFPVEGRARLNLFINFLFTMIEEVKAKRFVVAITDSSQIEEVKTVNIAQLRSVITNDFAECDPPNCLYNVVVK